MERKTGFALLTTLAVHKARDSERLADGGGLNIKVKDGHAAAALRFTSPALLKVREMGLGLLDRSSLAKTGESLAFVRELATDARRQVRAGVDPIEQRNEAREAAKAEIAAKKVKASAEATTLARYARRYFDNVIEPKKSMTDLHKRHWISSLENHMPPSVWHAPIASITPPQLLRELATIRSIEDPSKAIPETLSRIRQRLEWVFEDALFHGVVTTNPAHAIRKKLQDHTEGRKGGEGFAFLPPEEVPAFMRQLRERTGTAGRALELAVLTASRTNEVLGAVWSEFDLKASTWTVPAKRMKAGLRGGDHVVHLSKASLAVLKTVKGLDPVVVFPSPTLPGRALSNMGMLTMLDRMKVRDRTTVHGFRKSFSTWANDHGIARADVIEAALAHSEADKVRAAYNRAQFIAERRQLLDAWADFCDGKVPASNVVPIAATKVAA